MKISSDIRSEHPMRCTLGRNVGRVLLATMVVQSIPAPAFAAPVTPISNVPLVTAGGERAKPNFLFILDDSASMNLEYMPGDPETDDQYQPNQAGSFSSLCNKIYFNPDPTVTYSLPPDPGKVGFLPFDSTRTDFSAAPEDGFNPRSPTHNLNQKRSGNLNGFALLGNGQHKAFYYTYTPIAPYTFVESRDCRAYLDATNPAPVTVNSEGSPSSGYELYGTWTRQNIQPSDRDRFARWFSFYRTRLNIMKSAAALAFSYPTVDDRLRIGLITTTPSADGVTATTTVPVDARRFLPVKDFDDAWKKKWLEKLYGLDAKGNTPLKLALSRAGWYFGGRTDGPATGMINPVLDAQGKAADGCDDPVQYACQRNYSLLTTDGYYTNEPSAAIWNGPTGNPCVNPDNCDVGQRDGVPFTPGTPAPFNDTIRVWKVGRQETKKIFANTWEVRGQPAVPDLCSVSRVGNALSSNADLDLTKITVRKYVSGVGYIDAYTHTVASPTDDKATPFPMERGLASSKTPTGPRSKSEIFPVSRRYGTDTPPRSNSGYDPKGTRARIHTRYTRHSASPATNCRGTRVGMPRPVR